MIKSFGKFNESEKKNKNYMFFSNLKTINRLSTELLKMDESEIDELLDSHDWASDHMSTSTDDLEEVFNFILSKSKKGDKLNESSEVYKLDNLEFEQNEYNDKRYNFSFNIGENDYSGSILLSKYERNPDEIDWDIEVPENWEEVEELLNKEFSDWMLQQSK